MRNITENMCLAASGLLLAAGCGTWAVGPDYVRKDVKVSAAAKVVPDAGWPSTNLTASGEYVPAITNDPRSVLKVEDIRTWWKQFNDDTLSSLVENAISNNRSFLMAQSRLEQARWRHAGSWGDLMPHLNGGGTVSKSDYGPNTSTGYSSKHTVKRDIFHAGFDASWEIDIFGGVRRGIEEARAQMEAANCNLANAWVSLSSEIGLNYISLRTIQQRLQVARTNLKLQTETYDILKSRLDSGIGDELAVNQAKYNVEQTHATIPTLLMEEETLMNRLAVLAGTMPGALHAQLSICPDRDWLVAPQRLEEIPLETMRARPDVKAVEYMLMAQVAHVGVAESMLYPKFHLNGSLGLESLKVQKFLKHNSLYESIGPSFSWPLFQGGNLFANLKAEEAAMDEAVYNYEYTMQTAFGEIRNAYSGYTQSYHRYEALKAAVKAAKDAESISQDLYKNGLADFNNVLDAQRSLLTLEEALTITRGTITRYLIQLYKTLGGGIAM